MEYTKRDSAPDKQHNDIVAGRNSVREAILSGRPIDSVMIAKGERQGSLHSIIQLAKQNGIPVREVAPIKLDSLCPGGHHQGICASTAAHDYASVEDIFALAESRGEPPFIILADGIADPHNLGAIIRTAEAVGAHGVIVPKRRATGLTWTVGKASAGALEYIPVARVSNLAQCIDELKKRGVWICAADMDGESWCGANLSGAIGLVIGGEDGGVSRLVREKCDFIISMPMFGRINSLNASCACAVTLYEIARQRHAIPANNKFK
ncbi:MAG: 23S rRNA (guanosine(2251)-2'-O)-methyltransferase RlmB [Clostridia bacterium]|nr:23S rRNA (guanosine(2251)-2'-O)-methyltransferase RlmB [Clostridia bacterium]MBQ9994322.1 23S rRNA (guanosine(2251)-2'-O)-methyltransferase RlmB [Clostridia bacterium]